MKRYPLPPYPNGWFKVCFSDELEPGAVRAVHGLGRELAVWRGGDGRARVLDAYCAHLGAHLGYGGRVEGNELRCPFHAWRYDGDTGRCTDIPYASKIPAKAQVASWSVQEKNGYVAVWFHVEGKPPEWDFPEIPEVADPAYYLYKRRRWELDTHLQDVYENAVDVKHFSHVHGMEVEDVQWIPDGPHVAFQLDFGRAAEQQSDEEGRAEIRSFMWGPGLSLTRTKGKMNGVSVQTLTPVDEEKVEICHTYYARRDEARGQGEIEGFFDFYASDWELDFNLWNHKVFRARPPLAEGDGPIGRYRRWYRQFYSTPVEVEI